MSSQPSETAARPPGLDKRTNRDGSIRCYWRAEKRYAEAGFEPRVVRLAGDWSKPADRPRISDQCHRLQAQMLALVDGDGFRSASPLGSIEYLCDLYQRHPQSPYKSRRRATQYFYDRAIQRIRETVGKRQADKVTGADIRKWWANWSAPMHGDMHGKPRIRRAKQIIQTLRVVVAFGCEFKNKGAMEMRAILQAMRFENPPKRTKAMSREQCEAICKAARELGYPSLARAVALQFWTTLRQKDVIGEWIRLADGKRDRWEQGLEWEKHLSRSMQLSKPTSKSNGRVVVEYDLTEIPAVMREFEDVPVDARTGPVIVSEGTGRPFTAQNFNQLYRKAAARAGVPRDIWNMDSRAGGITEALGAGASLTDVMKAAGHTQVATTTGYHRGSADQTKRVAKLRVAHKRSEG